MFPHDVFIWVTKHRKREPKVSSCTDSMVKDGQRDHWWKDWPERRPRVGNCFKCGFRVTYLSKALAASWRPRARPSCIKAVLRTCWRAVRTSICPEAARSAAGAGTSLSMRWDHVVRIIFYHRNVTNLRLSIRHDYLWMDPRHEDRESTKKDGWDREGT